jgi:hypothetical protein
MVPNFTRNGYEIIQTPKHIHEALLQQFQKALNKWDYLPNSVQAGIFGPTSKFYNAISLGWNISYELKESYEQWLGQPLKPTHAFGLRIYVNGSSLSMHRDKVIQISLFHHQYRNDIFPTVIFRYAFVNHSYRSFVS